MFTRYISVPLIIITFTLTSCDPGAQYSYIVKNNSSYHTRVTFQGNYVYGADSLRIVNFNPGDEKTVCVFEVLGTGWDLENTDTMTSIDRCEVFNTDSSFQSTSNFRLHNKWAYKNTGKHNHRYSAEYKLEVTDSDF